MQALMPVCLMQVARCFAGIPARVLYTLGIAASALALYIGALSSGVIIFVLATCLVMLLFAIYLARWVIAKDEGTADMQEVSFSWTYPLSAGWRPIRTRVRLCKHHACMPGSMAAAWH